MSSQDKSRAAKLDKLAAHWERWKNCDLCTLGRLRKRRQETSSGEWGRVCMGRGDIAAETILVSLSPGRTDDRTGLLFSGPVESVFDRLLDKGGLRIQGAGINCYVTSIVGCRALTASFRRPAGDRVRSPSGDEASACLPRVEKLLRIMDPKVIVLLGNETEKLFFADPGSINYPYNHHGTHILKMVHPGKVFVSPDRQSAIRTYAQSWLKVRNINKMLEGYPGSGTYWTLPLVTTG